MHDFIEVTPSSETLKEAVNYIWGTGVVLACAAWNSSATKPLYPAFYSGCLAVAATDEADRMASWSNYGSWVDLAVPGVEISMTTPLFLA